MNTLRLIIVDDEKRARTAIRNVIKLHYPAAEVVAEGDGIESAAVAIRKYHPDVVLLDIKMPGGSGFELLKQFMPLNFKVIFITAFNQYAIQAFKFSALDYLLKPVIPLELVEALSKAEQQIKNEDFATKFYVLLNNMNSVTRETKKIVLNSHDKIDVVDISNIVRCKAEQNYTLFLLTGNKSILVTGSLVKYDEMLTPFGFFRCHHSHLVNLSFIDRLEKRDGGILIMKDGAEVPVSVRKHCELLAALNRF